MKFKAQTEDDLKRGIIIPAGEYEFKVTEAVDTTSSKGNDMIALVLDIMIPDKNARRQKDWLLSKMMHKLRHFCYATGLGPAYEAGEFSASDCVGRSGKLILEVDERYPAMVRNVVKDYIVTDTANAVPVIATTVKPVVADDEPPF